MKHVIDHPKDSANSRRSANYTRIEADTLPRPQTQALQKRSRKADDGTRLKNYTKIERDQVS